MADGLFKVVVGLNLEPIDPITIQNPKKGMLIIDINDDKLKIYDESKQEFVEVN